MHLHELTQRIGWALARFGRLFRRVDTLPAHMRTGRTGEELAYRYLRGLGYVMVARNWRVKGYRGEIDLIGWQGGTLCFIEVKTRSERGMVPAEMAVDARKQAELRRMAGLFLRKQKRHTDSRFDVVSVYLCSGEPPKIELFKDAFGWRSMGGRRRQWR